MKTNKQNKTTRKEESREEENNQLDNHLLGCMMLGLMRDKKIVIEDDTDNTGIKGVKTVTKRVLRKIRRWFRRCVRYLTTLEENK